MVTIRGRDGLCLLSEPAPDLAVRPGILNQKEAAERETQNGRDPVENRARSCVQPTALQAMSKRSAFITLFHAATKSVTNFSFASS